MCTNEELFDSEAELTLTAKTVIPRRGGVCRIEQDGSDSLPCRANHNQNLVKCLVEATAWRQWIESGEITTIEELATRTKHDRKYVSEILRFAFLAPDIQRAIVEGRQPGSLTVGTLAQADLPLLWSEQAQSLQITPLGAVTAERVHS